MSHFVVYVSANKIVFLYGFSPPKTDWRTAIKIAETFDEDTLNILTQKYTNQEPNTYTFTKGLAEQAVLEFSTRLPIVIYRPSIVVSSLDEPMPGWIDNFNGPTGLLIACGLGLLRTSYADPNVVSDFTPVDTSIKAMIVAAWQRGIKAKTDEVPVYNCSTSIQRKFTTGFIVEMGRKLAPDVPIDKMLWLPGGKITKCKYNNYIKVMEISVKKNLQFIEFNKTKRIYWKIVSVSVYTFPAIHCANCRFNI